MSWFSKAKLTKISDAVRNRGQIPFGMDEIFDDPYSRKNKSNPRGNNKKDLFQGSLGFGTEGYNAEQETASGPNKGQINSLTSGHTTDEIMDEGLTGEDVPRNQNRGGPAIGDSPMGAGAGAAPGTEDDGYGSYILRHTPNDSTVDEVAIKNNLRFQKRTPKRTAVYNGYNVNVID